MTSPTQQEANPPSGFSITDMRKERNCSEIMIDHNNDTINSSEHVGVLSLHPFYTSTPKSARIICVECRRKPFHGWDLIWKNYRPTDRLQQAVI